MNDLVHIESSDLAELAEILGTKVSGNNEASNTIVRVPELKINSRSRDKLTKKPIPEGYFYLTNMEKTVYAETVTFRPLASHIQYFHWDDVDGERKLVCKSRAVKTTREEARDTRGGIACGMPDWDRRKELPREEQAKWRAMQMRVTRGLVSLTGETADGEEVTYENIPCIMFHKNSNYSGFWKQFMKKVPKGRHIHEYQAVLSSEYQENGSVVWYTFNYDIDLSSTLPLTKEVFDTMKVFAETIQAENKYVDQKYFEALKEGALDDSAIEALGDTLDDDFEDVA